MQPRRVLQVLGALVLLLVMAHIGSQLLRAHYGPEYAKAMVRLFDLDGEGNLPTLFSAGLFLVNALLFYFAWRSSVRSGAREAFWLLMCVVFVLLAFDEIGALHERLDRIVGGVLPGTAGGAFRFAWVVPYGIAAVVFGALCVPVLRRIGARVAALLGLSGVVYLSGTGTGRPGALHLGAADAAQGTVRRIRRFAPGQQQCARNLDPVDCAPACDALAALAQRAARQSARGSSQVRRGSPQPIPASSSRNSPRSEGFRCRPRPIQ